MAIRDRISQFVTYLVKQIKCSQGGILIGRVTGEGKAQEITVGSGLTLSGTTLTVTGGTFAAASHTHALSDLSQSAAESGQVVTWNGSAWSASTIPSSTGGNGTSDSGKLVKFDSNGAITVSWLKLPQCQSHDAKTISPLIYPPDYGSTNAGTSFESIYKLPLLDNMFPDTVLAKTSRTDGAVSYNDLVDVPAAVSLTASKSVANAAARLALSLEAAQGFAVVDADTGKTWMLVDGGTPSVSGDWLQLGDTDITAADITDPENIVTNARVATASAQDPATMRTALGIGTSAVENQLRGACGRMMAHSTNVSNGTDLAQMSRVGFEAPVSTAIRDLKLIYENRHPQEASSAPNAVTYRASIEYPSGTFYPVFFNGVRDVTVAPDGIAESDDITPVEIPAGAQFWVRTFTSIASGTFYLGSRTENRNQLKTANLDGGSVIGASATDQTMSGTIANSNNYASSVTAIIGKSSSGTPLKCVGIMGDSISAATYNYDYPWFSWEASSIAGELPVLQLAVSGEKISDQWTVSVFKRHKRIRLLSKVCTHAICALGINDVSAGATATTLKANYIILWTALNSRGVKVYQTTLTPYSASTDSWATLENQTPGKLGNATYEAHRITVNDWIRDGAPMLSGVGVATGSTADGTLRTGDVGHPLSGFIEVADAVESSRNSGKWKVTGAANYATSDGVHPTQAMFILMQASFNASIFD